MREMQEMQEMQESGRARTLKTRTQNMRKLALFMLLTAMLVMSAIPAGASVPKITKNKYAKFVAAKNMSVYTDSKLKTRGTASPKKRSKATVKKGKEVRILTLTKKYAKISYTLNKKKVTGYVAAKDITTNNISAKTVTSRDRIKVTKTLGGAGYGYISGGDKIYPLAKNGKYTQVAYSVGGTYKIGWITTSNLNSTVAAAKISIPSAGKTVSTGYYYLESYNGWRLDINGASKKDGANAQLWQKNNTAAQIFKVEYMANGYYAIINAYSGKVLDIYDNRIKSGTNVIQYSRHGASNQQWQICKSTGGRYRIVSKANKNLSLDMYGGAEGAKNGTNVCVYTNNLSKAQQWKFVPCNPPTADPGTRVIEDGYYRIESTNGWRLDINGASKSDSAKAQIFEKNDSYAQIFEIKYMNNGFYAIINYGSGKVLDVYDARTKDGTQVIQYGWNGGDNQQWKITKWGNTGYYRISSKMTDDLSLDINGGIHKAKNGTKIDVWTSHDTSAQQWSLSKVTFTMPMSYVLYGATDGRLTCRFDGYDPAVWGSYRHEGIDFAKADGAAVYSLLDGEVIRVAKGSRGSDSSNLSTIAIYNSEYNKTVIYLHSNPIVSTGQKVSKGQHIAYEDARGAGGPHTHVELKKGYVTYASVSKDSALVNANPNSFWNSVGYSIE